MAEYTIKHVDATGKGQSGSGQRPGKSLDETKLATKIGKIYEKVAKDTNASLAKNLNKELDRILTKLIREMVRHQGTATGAGGAGISKQDIGRIVKDATKTVSVDAANSLLKELQKIKPGQAGGSRELESVFKSIDRKIGGMAGAINTALSKANVELSPQGIKILSNAISASLRGAVSKEFGTAIKDFSKTVESLSRGLDATNKALESFSKLKKSGGGIDIKEVPQAIKSVGNVAKEFKNVNNDFTTLNRSVKSLVRDQKALMKEVADAVSEMKKSITQKVQTTTQSPPNLLDASKWKKIADDFISRYERITKSIKLDTKITGGAALPNREIKQLESTTRDTGKKIDTLTKTVEKVYKDTKKITSPAGNKPDKTVRNLDNLYKEISKLIAEIRKQSRAKGDVIAKEVQSDTKDVKLLENFRAERKDLIKAIESGKPEEIKTAAGRGILGVDSKLTDQLRALVNVVEKSIQGRDKSDVDSTFMEGIKKSVKSGITEAMETATTRPETAAPTKAPAQASETGPLIKSIELLNSKLRGPQSVNVYPEAALPATKAGFNLQFESTPSKQQQSQQKLVQDRISSLSSSLVDLQNYIVDTMEKEFADAGKRWAVVREGTEKSVQEFFSLVKGSNVKEAGKQFSFDIANVEQIKKQLFLKGRGSATKGTPASMVKELTDVLSTELAAKLPSQGDAIGKIAEWLKVTTEDQIKSVKELESVQSKLLDIKRADLKGVLPGEAIKEQLRKVIAKTRTDLEIAFKATVGKTGATSQLREKKLVRTVSLPAARLTKTGTPVFETAKGSQRALQRFGTFKTGFEQIYEDLAKKQALSYSKGYAEKIRNIGVKPTGFKLDQAQKLAEEILVDFASLNFENFKAFRTQVGKAAEIKAPQFGGGGKKFKQGIAGILSKDTGKQLQPAEYNKATTEFITAMKQAGLSAYDVVKSLDKIEFQNVYDVLLKVLKGTEGKSEPLKSLAKNPTFDQGIRVAETAIKQVVQSLPLIEPGRPRRGFQQENVLNLLTRTSDVYAGQKTTDFSPKMQNEFLKDLNVRLNELVKEAKISNEFNKRQGSSTDSIIKEGVRTISTLGLPESLGSKVDFYRPGQTKEGTQYLGALGGESVKLFTDILPELAPFGAQFNQLGRNISNVTNALSSSKSELDRIAKEFKATTLEGFGTEFPGLRTERESELISGGRLGTKGFGFNVLTELRHTAGTMEDQILVSGKFADALTSVTKTLVRPSPAGRLGGGLATATGITDIQSGPVKDSDISVVLDKIQEVLGVPEQYKGRADQAFIDEVRRAITVVRGEEVEVQQARLTEVFLNSFGRKITSRFGSKGVSVSPTGLGKEEASQALDIIKSFPKAKVKVLTEGEREKAGLGVALLPRSMGELLSEVLGKYQKKLEGEGFDVAAVQRMLLASGNKFVFELFKDAGKGLVVPEEAAQQQRTFQRASGSFKSITGRELPGDKSAIQEIRNLFKKEIGGGVFKERAIDVRISSLGVAKRGLQPEVLESVVGNITSVGDRGATTINTRLGQDTYESLLGGGGKAGELSKLSKSLGFETVGTREDIDKLVQDIGRRGAKGKTDEEIMANKEIITSRAAAVEAMSNYYTTVIDEFGEKRKSIVGTKFLSIIEETGETEPWRREDVRRGTKGASVDIPVFSAYATVFGENSKLLKEISDSTNANQKKQLEFLKALQIMADESGSFQDRQIGYLEKVKLSQVAYFDQTTGILGSQADDLDSRNLKNTVFDTDRFSKPFLLDLPKSGGEVGETEPFYVPGALARGTYAEELIGGERGVEDIGRKLQHVVNMAKKATELLDRPATLQSEIDTLQAELQNLIQIGDPRAAQVETVLKSRQDVQTRLLSGEGEVSSTVKRRVKEVIGDYLKESQALKFKATPESTNRLNEILNVVKGALSKSEAPAEAFRVKRFGSGQAPLSPGASEVANVESFLERQKGTSKTDNLAIADAIGKSADLLIGKGPGAQDIYNTILKGIADLQAGKVGEIENYKRILQDNFKFKGKVAGDPQGVVGQLKEYHRLMQSEMQATEKQMFRLADDIRGGGGLELAARLGIDIDSELQFKYQKALDNLQKAKIDYFHGLAQKAVGKEGAIGTAVFSRKFPAVMKKATTAIVDKTKDFENFKGAISAIQASLPGDVQGSLGKVMSEIDILSKEHSKKLGQQKRGGFPVLKQHEVGIPEVTAKKLPFNFKSRFDFKDGDVSSIRKSFKNIDGTLYDYLKYIENLEEVITSTDDAQLKELASKELKDVGGQGAVEAIRYPFTGPSSIVPYQAKLLQGEEGLRAKNTFVVPGAPEFDINKFNDDIKKPVEGIIDVLAEARNKLFEEADKAGTSVDESKVKGITSQINSLAKAVSDVTPKYAAHTAKLDFDGDAIAVHTASTRKAREEIQKHFKTVAEYDNRLQSVYRDFFTEDALKSQSPTGTAILAEMAETFYKKRGPEQGFDFLTRPYLTGQAAAGEDNPTLEFASRGEKLSILGIGSGSIKSSLEDTISEALSGTEISEDLKKSITDALDAIKSPFDDLKGELASTEKLGGIKIRIGFAEELFKALEVVDKNLTEQIQSAVTGRVFNERYRGDIESQLFKIQTGVQTEALYRLGRLAEGNVGFGKGLAGTGTATGTSSAGFSKRNPNLKILGGGEQAVIDDFFAKFNEVFRFAIQKGMDIKRGTGGRTVAAEIERSFARGAGGATELWDSINNVNDDVFGELRDFRDVINKSAKLRVSNLPTDTIRDELTNLYEARGQDYSPAEIAKGSRDDIIKLAVDAVGLKSFIDEMTTQVQEGAIEGIVKQVSQYSPEKQSQIGDKLSYAKSLVKDEISDGGINIREHITIPKLPLYALRQEKGLKSQLKRFKDRYGDPSVPQNIKFSTKGDEETDRLLEQFKQAKATSRNIQDAFADAAQDLSSGAYNDLVQSTLKNIHGDQAKIEAEFTRLKGFDVSKVKNRLDLLVQRTSEQSQIPDITKEILNKGPEQQVRRLEELADLVGVPTLSKEEKLDVSASVLKDFRKQGEKKFSGNADLSIGQISDLADTYAKEMANAATVVFEMDRIIDVMTTRAQEGITLLSLFPESGTVGAQLEGGGKSYKFAQRMKTVASEGQAKRAENLDLFGPNRGGTIGGGLGAGIPTGNFPMGTGAGVVPVHIHSIAEGVGVMFGGGEALPSGRREQLNPAFKPQEQALKDLEKIRATGDQHGADALLRIQKRLQEIPGVQEGIKGSFKNVEAGYDRHKGRFADPKFKELQGEFFPGIDPADYKELQKQFFTTTLKTFSGSKFHAGGKDVGAVLKDVKSPGEGHRKSSQLEAISEAILGADQGDFVVGKKRKIDPATQAAFDIGSALHSKMQRKIAKDFEGLEESVDIEKFVHLNPQEFVEAIEGPITGFIDVTYKNAKGEIDKISDIKTTGETFAKFESLTKLIPEGGIALGELLNKEMPGHIRQKLEEYRTQLNVYLAALKQRAGDPGSDIKLAENLQAQIDFIPSEDTELKTPPRSVTFSFDESRLREDLETLQTARELITKYVHDLSVEIEDVPAEHRDLVASLRNKVSGKAPGASVSRTLESFQLEQRLDDMFGVVEQSDQFIEDYVKISRQVFEFMQGQENVYKEAKDNFKKAEAMAGQAAEELHDVPGIDQSKYSKVGPSPEERSRSKTKVQGRPEPLKDQFQALQELHTGSVAVLAEVSDLDFNESLSKMHADIQGLLKTGQAPPTGPKFSQALEELTNKDLISFRDSMKAWQLWRIAMADFLIEQAKEAEASFDIADQKGIATREFSGFKKRVEKLRDFVVKGLGKRTDIYTKDRRFLLPEQAEKAEVFASPSQLFEQSAAPFEDDEFTRGVYKDFLDNLNAGTLGAPADEINKIAEQLANVDKEAERVLSDIDLFERKGKDATEAWDFDAMAKRARNFREALSQYSRTSLSDEFQVDVEKQFQVRSLLQYLKQIEQVYGRINLDKLQKGPYGRLETGAIKVPGFLPPGQQEALNRRNLEKFREFGRRPAGPGEGEGGPEIGESFSLFQKVTDQAGNVLKSTRTDFKKYGEVIDENEEVVGKFTESQTDLIDKMQMSGGTFRSATRRVIMWGAAASLVYGGVQELKDSIGELADIEVSIAQLRMVMNPLDTDFDSLTRSAVGFAKEYGVGINEVLRGMKIFAQQGLAQQEVIDRTRVSTLAANVTTLSAYDATEALTAAMKVFGNELSSADMALDAWSETEARHAITAGDMANAIKKSAAAAKNAGFTFNELNGIVAGIGAVTRQTGKEVGTAIRFIARRLFSEKGPTALAGIEIPTVTGTGENRRGFDVLSDLSMKWDELTNAQKLNIAQSLGGTRQYNSLLVAMDNWQEVLEAIEDSTNSKGSAERRNVEIMKTYQKQVEQTKAAATELKMQLGGFVFPIFKTGLKGLRILFELMSAIPAPVKAAGVALGLFFTYASKGLSIFDGVFETFSKGSSAIGNFANSIKDEFAKAKFEILGKGFGPDVEGLKTFAKGAPIDLKAGGLNDLHSGFGKLTYLIKDAGDQYNEFLGDVGSKSGDFGKGLEAFGKKFKNTAKIIDFSTDLFQFLGLSTAPWVSVGTQVAESLAKGTGYAIEKSGQLFGKSGETVAKFFADTDPGLFKSIAPLALTIGSMGIALKSTASALDRTRKSAQDYAQSVYNTRRVEEDQIKSLTNTVRQYDRLEQRLKRVDKVLKTPGLKENQQASDNYTAPILALADIQSDATKLGNELAKINNKLVIGYDEQGDAILRLTGNYKTYIESLQRSSSLELAKTDIDVLKKFSESLTDTGLGETIKQTLKTTLGEVPGFGGVLSDLVAVAPGKEMETITGQLNDLLSLREEYPLSDAFDQDIDKLQEALGKVKKIYDTTIGDFKRTLAGIFKFEGAQNLDRDTIANLLSDPGLTKGFELLLEVEPKIAEVNKTRLSEKVSTGDIVGSEILKRIFPQKKAIIDYTSELTAAQIEGAGILAREGKKVASGDVVTFFPELARVYNIAGSQAIVELKKTTDGVYEAFVTYINSKTLEVEERALDDSDLMRMVDRIFPSGRVQAELENRLNALNTFVAGAGAGLVAIDAKKFKQDFDLGPRFYSELPTTTALQATQGFNVQTNDFGPLPQLQQEWARMTKDFFIEPMGKYNREVESLSKNTLDGLGESAQLTKQKADELFDQQAILRNNQVVTQFAAVFADLAKSMEESSRVLKENVAVEKSRQESVRVTTGLMKGLPEGFDAIDTGIRKVADLSSKQLAALNNPEYRRLAGQARVQQVGREGAIGQLDALEKARVAIETITATQGGLGSIVGPDAGPKAVEGFIQKAAAIQDVGMATLSYDINNLDTTSRKGFGEVVDRLETMIANQGNLTGYTDKVDDLAKRAAGPLNARGAELLGGKIATEMQGLAGVRETLRGKGDQRGVGIASAYIDQLTDILVQVRGVSGGSADIEKFGKFPGPLGYIPPASKFEITPEEFQQRAFRNLQPNELIERFRTEGGPEQFGGGAGLLNPTRLLKSLDSGTRERFEKSSEYKDLLDVQKDSKKIQEKSFLDSKTILKGSIAIATFEAFNKKHSSRVLDNLNEQLTTAESELSDTGAAATPEQEKKVASLRQAVSEQESNLRFHGLVAAMTQITGTTTALGKVLGISETSLKRVNVSAVGLYLAMQAASKVTGKDLPESAKEFGGVLKDAVGELKDGDLKTGTLRTLKNAGKKFEEVYGERVKDATGKTKEAISKEIKERLAGMKDLSQAEIDERSKNLRKQASSEGAPGIKALIAALSAATIAGAAYEITGRGTANSERERLAERQADIFNSIIEKYPEAADAIAKELVEQVQARAAEVAKVVVDTAPENQLLDIRAEEIKAYEFLDESISKTKKTIEEASEAFNELADQMAKFEMIAELNKATADFIRTLSDAATEFEVRRTFGGAGILNSGLSGFAGDAELPLQANQMSTQQRLFSTMGDDFQNSISDYSYGLQTVNSLVDRLAEATKRRGEFIENNIEDPEVWQSLESEIDATKESIKNATDVLRPFGDALGNMVQYADSVNKLNDAFSDIAARQAVETLPGFKKFRDDMDRMLGGAHPDAIVSVTPEQEREGRSVGVQLRQFESTKYDLERVRILKQLQTAEGADGGRLQQSLRDLPERRRREVETYRQRTEDRRLQEQQQPFQQALTDVQRLRDTREPTPSFFGFGADKIDEGLREYQESILLMLRQSTEKVSREDLAKEIIDAGKKPIFGLFGKAKLSEQQVNAELQRINEGPDRQYRGTLATGRADIDKQQTEVYEELRRQAPTREMSDLKVAIAEPIVRELETQTGILKIIAEQGFGISKETLDRTSNVVSPFEAEKYKSPGSGILESIFRNPFKSMPTNDRIQSSGFPGLTQYNPERERGDSTSNKKTIPSISKDTYVPEWYEDYYKWVTDKFDYDIGKKAGGQMFGPGGPKDDKIPALLSAGEFVMKTSAAKNLGYDTLEYMNSHGELPKFADGGTPELFGPKKHEDLSTKLFGPKKHEDLKAELFGPKKHEDLSTKLFGPKLPKFADGGVIGNLASWAREQGDYWKDRRLSKVNEGMHTIPGQILDLPGEWSGNALASIFDLVGVAADPKGTAVGIKSAFNSIKENPATAFKAVDKALAEEWASGATSLLNPLEQLSMLGGVAGKLPKATNVLSKIAKPLRGQIGTLGTPDLDTLSKLPLKDRIKYVMAAEGIDPSKTAEMTAATRKLIGDAKDPSKDILKDIPKGPTEGIIDLKKVQEVGVPEHAKDRISDYATKRLSERTIEDASTGISKKLPLIKLAEKQAEDFAALYPDVFKRVEKGKAQFGDHPKFIDDPETSGLFSSPKKFESRINKDTPYSILLNKNLLEGPASQIGTVVKHEGFHALERFVKDKITKQFITTGRIDPELAEMKTFMDSFGKRTPFTDRAKLALEEGDSFATENFAEFARSVMQGGQTGDLVDEFERILNPKFFQTGEAFGMGGRARRKKYAEGGLIDPDRYKAAQFAEESASKTGERFGREANELNRARQQLSPSEIKAAQEAAYNRRRRREIENDPDVVRMLRKPGIDQEPGDKAIRKAYGLDTLNFDKRTGVVGFEGLKKGRISYHDLNEIKYQDLKREIEAGKINKPTVAAGFRATAGEDPVYKSQLEKAKKERAALEPVWAVQPGSDEAMRLGQLYGREAELVWPIWRRLLNSEFDDNEEIQKYRDQAKGVMTDIDTPGRLSAENIKAMEQLVEADKKGLFLGSAKPPAAGSKEMTKALAMAKAGQDQDKIYDIASKFGLDMETATRLYNGNKKSKDKDSGGMLLDSILRVASPGIQIVRDLMKLRDKTEEKSAGTLVEEKAKKDLEKFSLDAFLKKPTPTVQLIKDMFGRANGGSIPFYQSGGPVTQSGPIYAHKGEFVVPKGFADGGLVTSDIADAALKEGTIKLEDNGLADMIADKIREAIESSEVKVDEDAVVKVDVVDVSIPVDVGDAMVGVDTTNVLISVDTEGAVVPIDAESIGGTIGQYISEAIASATVDVNVNQTGRAAVGAEEIDEFGRAIQGLDDRVLNLNDSMDIKIETSRNETLSAVQSEIASQVNNALNRIQHDINQHRNEISNFNSELRRLDHQYDYRIREVDRLAKDAQNLAQRPTSSLTLP